MFTLKSGEEGLFLFLSSLADGSSVFFMLFLAEVCVCARECMFILCSEIYWKE